jgi:hypothetical protein
MARRRHRDLVLLIFLVITQLTQGVPKHKTEYDDHDIDHDRENMVKMPPHYELKHVMDGARMKTSIIHLKEQVCISESNKQRCGEGIARKFASLLATGGVPDLFTSTIEPHDKLMFVFKVVL